MTLLYAGTARKQSGFTLLELMTVLVIISILIVVVAPVFPYLKARAQKVGCLANLRSLHVAVNTYVQDNRQWPQIASQGFEDSAAAKAWINALSPYGLTQINWVCPAVQETLHSPNLTDPENLRVDYMGMPFGPQPRAPFQSDKIPWFSETASIHGNGQELIFADGHIAEANDIFRSSTPLSRGSPPSSSMH